MTTKLAYTVGLFVLGTCGVFVASHRVVKHGQQDKSAMSKQGAEMEAVQNAEEETKPAAKLEAVQKTYEEKEEEEAAELQASGLIEKETNEGGMEGSIVCKSWCIKCGNHQIFVERESSNKQKFASGAKIGALALGAGVGGVGGALLMGGAGVGAEKLFHQKYPGADCAKVKIYSSNHGDTPTADSKIERETDFHYPGELAVLRMAPNVERFVDFMKAMSHEKICDGSQAEAITEYLPRVVGKWKVELREKCLAIPQ